MKMIKKAKKGFTLIELVVVIAVIAILSGVSVVAYVGITNNAKEKACESEASQLRTIILAADIEDDTFYCEGTTKITLKAPHESIEDFITSLKADQELAQDMAGLEGTVEERPDHSVWYKTDNGKEAKLFEICVIEEAE